MTHHGCGNAMPLVRWCGRLDRSVLERAVRHYVGAANSNKLVWPWTAIDIPM
jgi:hypothetical protein